MRKIALALGALLTLTAGGAAPVAAGGEDTQIALFQDRNIFHSGLRDAHTIALTFDDGPNAHTDEVLDALKEMHVKATFFIVGKQARAHRDVLAASPARGICWPITAPAMPSWARAMTPTRKAWWTRSAMCTTRSRP